MNSRMECLQYYAILQIFANRIPGHAPSFLSISLCFCFRGPEAGTVIAYMSAEN